MTLRKGGGEGVERSIWLHESLFHTSLEGAGGEGQPTGDSTSINIMVISAYISYILSWMSS